MSLEAKFQLYDGSWSDYGDVITGLSGTVGPSLPVVRAMVGKQARIGVRPPGGEWVFSEASPVITSPTAADD